MKKIIHYDTSNLGNLHCDECGYDSPEKREFVAELIGTPCPKCGANMLTERDYHDTLKMLKFADNLNKWLGWLGTEDPGPQEGYDRYTSQVKIHNGNVEFRSKK